MRYSSAVVTRSVRRSPRTSRPARAAQPAALQVFLFRVESFLGTELFSGDGAVLVGRGPRALLRLDGDTVSRAHARLSIDNGQVFVEDLSSGNGTFLNRTRIKGRVAVAATDTVSIGAYTLKLRALTPDGAIPAGPIDDQTTRLEAILHGEKTAPSGEIAVDLPGFVDRLYEDAVRRKTGGETAQRPVSMPARPASPRPVDSTLQPAAAVTLRPESRVAIVDDDDTEARLRDLDELIAALDAELDGTPRPQIVSTPLPAPKQAPALSTREFARSLASKLALDGQVVAEAAQVIPLRSRMVSVAPAHQVDDEDTTRAQDRQPSARILAPMDAERPTDPAGNESETPETELVDRSLPVLVADPAFTAGVMVAPKLDLGSKSEVKPEAKSSILNASKSEVKDGLRILSRSMVRRETHDAKLLTPAQPMPVVNDDYDDVWTHGGTGADPKGPRAVARASVPPPLPASKPVASVSKSVAAPAPLPPPRRVTEARLRERMGDADPSVKVSPAVAKAPVQMRQDVPAHHYDGVEISARVNGKLVDVAVLRNPNEQYVLGHRTPQGAVAPAKAHLGLRLVRINADRSVDLVFPKEVAGHVVRGPVTVALHELSEGRKYSCLKLDPQDVGTVILGEGKATISYHIRFLRRPNSLFAALRRTHP